MGAQGDKSIMKLGAGTYAWSDCGLSLEYAIREIASLGIRHIDVLGTGHGHPERLSLAEKHDMRKLMDDLGVSASSVLALYEGNIADGTGRSSILEYMKVVLEFCEILGARQILYKPGDKIIGMPNREAWDHSVAFSKEMSNLARQHGIYITFEVVPASFALVQTLEELNRMISAVAEDNVFANLDLGHVALARDNAEDVARVAPRTIHLHLNDNDTYVHTNDVVGTGSVPLKDYMEALLDNGAEATCRNLGIELVAGIEIEVADHSRETLTPLTITRQSRDYILENFPYISL
jgi:sugar phosphate isomerase/epimerase